MDKNTYTRPLPLFMFQHPYIPVAARVLLAYASYMNENAESWPNTRRVAILCGLVGEDGEPTPDDLKAVRDARAALKIGRKMREGPRLSSLLVHEKAKRTGDRPLDVYHLRTFPLKPGVLEMLNERLDASHKKEDPWSTDKFPPGHIPRWRVLELERRIKNPTNEK